MLNVAGHRIGTAEVESALVSHPAVAEAAAIGIPDALKGEAIVAFVQLRAGHVASDALTASLIEHVRREMGPIATPSAIKFVAALAEDALRQNHAPPVEGAGDRGGDWRSVDLGAISDLQRRRPREKCGPSHVRLTSSVPGRASNAVQY